MGKPRGNPKGSKRDEITIARVRLGLLETGWKRMLIRHDEEMTEQKEKIEAAKEALAVLEAGKK